MAKLTAACVQLRSGLNRAANIEDASVLIRQAHAQGAQLIATPEMTNVVDINAKRLMADLPQESAAPELTALSALAQELGIWLLVGSMAFKVADRQACNRCFLFDPGGEIVARYDKLHMFDVDLAGGERYRESKVYRRGQQAVVASTPVGKLGLSICYDLRFPHLYRALAQAGAEIIAVPAAFTRQTGERHWHTLLQARAIENGAFVIAPAQGGRHEDGRETYGHSLIIHPSGQILAELDSDEPGIIVAEIDTSACQIARSSIPNLSLETAFDVTNIEAMG